MPYNVCVNVTSYVYIYYPFVNSTFTHPYKGDKAHSQIEYYQNYQLFKLNSIQEVGKTINNCKIESLFIIEYPIINIQSGF
jgi:hypothetical protein